ncbi:MAG TPA: hypothetical protein VM260_07070 [Pirellula sp.]|nr:hypothetical protein [Pirellula sp.]
MFPLRKQKDKTAAIPTESELKFLTSALASVDLNPVRAVVVESAEGSQPTSVYERILREQVARRKVEQKNLPLLVVVLSRDSEKIAVVGKTVDLTCQLLMA